MNSSLCYGQVTHQRQLSPKHRFDYQMMMMWLDLDELAQLQGLWRRPWYWFRRDDYLANILPACQQWTLKQAVLARMSAMADTPLDGKVFMLGQVCTLGVYFSPVNFYLLEQDGAYRYLLAEVSNTPWNQRHHYLVPLPCDLEKSTKRFHVSPFMPPDLGYRWQVRIEPTRIRIAIDCEQQQRVFWAGLDLQRQPLTASTLRSARTRLVWTNLKALAGIYFEAVRLWRKGAKFYPHSGKTGNAN
ncbi:MAG: DUF1365 domain-containing protein [Ferrimonas sp.]